MAQDTENIDWEAISQYLKYNPTASNTRLFSYLALLNFYVPESYLVMSECQIVLGPPDLIFGGPPFEIRMEPFTNLIDYNDPEQVCFHGKHLAEKGLEMLEEFNISLIQIARCLLQTLCGVDVQPHTIQFIKDLLTKREDLVDSKTKFSQFIEDVLKVRFCNAESILKMASKKFRVHAVFTQTLARLYYIRGSNYTDAEKYAKEAIRIAPDSSYIADTLGQIYKNRLLRATPDGNLATCALSAFKDVDKKACEESLDETKMFNNRGLFGFVQVAKIIHEKLPDITAQIISVQEVEDKFSFFEWYLTYSRPDADMYEPKYFWKDVAACYEYYTSVKASESTSFPGLLESLNQGLFHSRGRRAGIEQTVPDLEPIQIALKLNYKEQTDVKAAERYILSNILLSNQNPDSPNLAPVEELKRILMIYMGTSLEARSPQFYLLVLMLFWPEIESNLEENSDNQASSPDIGIQGWDESNSSDETEDKVGEVTLQKQVTNMEKAFERVKYAKYLRGRYLIPLFFWGKGPGLNKWIHRSKLDEMVEQEANIQLRVEGLSGETYKTKIECISEIWSSGAVWHIPEIQEMLQPVNAEPMNIDPVNIDPVNAEPVNTEPVNFNPVNVEQVNAEPVNAEPVNAEPVNAEPVNAEPVNAEPVNAEPVNAEPVNAEPVNAEPVNAEPVNAEPVNAEPVNAKPVNFNPVNVEQVNAEPVNGEQVNAESVTSEEMWVKVGREKIKARTEKQKQVENPVCYYLGLNIKGPVVFTVGPPAT